MTDPTEVVQGEIAGQRAFFRQAFAELRDRIEFILPVCHHKAVALARLDATAVDVGLALDRAQQTRLEHLKRARDEEARRDRS